MNKHCAMLSAFLLLILTSFAQSIGINADASTPNPNAILDIKSANKGLLIPRMNAAARNAIPNTKGLLVYDTVNNNFWYNTGTEWQSIAVNSLATPLLAASGPWLLTGNAGTSDTANFLGTTDSVALNFRVNNQPSGRIDLKVENTSLGYQSLISNTTGANNTATGYEALKFNNTGVGNTAHGTEAMFGCNTGSYNTGMGYVALRGVTNSNNNTAVGATALASTRGDNNSGVGMGAMYNNTLGTNNAALGYQSLYTNTTGVSNTAIGTQALFSNTTAGSQTAIGYRSLYSNTTGTLNTAIGYQSLVSNTTGTENTASGYQSLDSNTSGSANTAFGVQALQRNTTGSFNIAVGDGALLFNTTGSNNVAIGTTAMEVNLTGSENIGIGDGSLGAGINSGSQNIAIGESSMLENNTGSGNIALGESSAILNTSGDSNTTVGASSNPRTRTGNLNTVIGSRAFTVNVDGSGNTAVGAESNTGSSSLNNATAIGFQTTVDASNKVRIGNSAVTVIEGQVPFTTPSDGRYKFNIREDVKGLDFILHLRPVTYQFDTKRFDASMNHQTGNPATATASGPASYAMQTAYDEATKIRRSGFIAQEVEQAANASGYDFSGIIKPKTEADHYSLSYDAFVVPLVRAVQEQQQLIQTQTKQIADLQHQIDEIKQLLSSSLAASANQHR